MEKELKDQSDEELAELLEEVEDIIFNVTRDRDDIQKEIGKRRN